jgi:hypothetical protein
LPFGNASSAFPEESARAMYRLPADFYRLRPHGVARVGLVTTYVASALTRTRPLCASGQTLFPFHASNEAYRLGVSNKIYGLTH